MKKASKQGSLEFVYASLNVLGNTPWAIDREVFDVFLEVWNSGNRLDKIPLAIYDLPELEKPENMENDPNVEEVPEVMSVLRRQVCICAPDRLGLC